MSGVIRKFGLINLLNCRQVPENGLPVDRELDIAVDFTAPASPGRYISYWKMASPSGQKFGQRVWVLIQVTLHCIRPFFVL